MGSVGCLYSLVKLPVDVPKSFFFTLPFLSMGVYCMSGILAVLLVGSSKCFIGYIQHIRTIPNNMCTSLASPMHGTHPELHHVKMIDKANPLLWLISRQLPLLTSSFNYPRVTHLIDHSYETQCYCWLSDISTINVDMYDSYIAWEKGWRC